MRSTILRLFFALLVFVSFSSGLAQQPARVWIDSDPALGMLFRDADDGFALLQGLHSPELEIAGISIVRGNSAIPDGERIARRIVEKCEQTHREKVPLIYPGKTSSARSAAAMALDKALAKKLTYISLGPLSNLAEYLQSNPTRMKNIERIIFLGGEWPGASFRAGGWNPYRFTDANFFKNPEAARVVLASGIPITFVPIDVARGITVSARQMKVLRQSQRCPAWVAREAGGWFLGWRMFFGVREAPIFDALALLAVSHPDLVETRPVNYAIERRGRHLRLLLNPMEVESKSGRLLAVSGFHQSAEAVVWKALQGGAKGN